MCWLLFERNLFLWGCRLQYWRADVIFRFREWESRDEREWLSQILTDFWKGRSAKGLWLRQLGSRINFFKKSVSDPIFERSYIKHRIWFVQNWKALHNVHKCSSAKFIQVHKKIRITGEVSLTEQLLIRLLLWSTVHVLRQRYYYYLISPLQEFPFYSLHHSFPVNKTANMHMANLITTAGHLSSTWCWKEV